MDNKKLDLTKLKTSWTKYDIVQVLDVVYSVETIQKYMKGEATINEPILKAFLGVKTLNDPIPAYWIDIQKYSDKEKKLFALAALLLTVIRRCGSCKVGRNEKNKILLEMIDNIISGLYNRIRLLHMCL